MLMSIQIISPATILKSEIQARKWDVGDMARKCNLAVSFCIRLLKNKVPITFEVAGKLAEGFGISRVFFLNLQHNYDLARCNMEEQK